MALEPPTFDLSAPGSVVYDGGTMPAHNVNWDAIDWVQVRPGMERKTFAGEGATLALFRIQPNHERLPHSHHYEQIVYMLRGTANFHVGEEVHRLTGGCLLAIPPNVTHYIDVQGDEEVLELDVFTPKRPEYGG
jgi:quercetin dioxygenase-like cupin family protein